MCLERTRSTVSLAYLRNYMCERAIIGLWRRLHSEIVVHLAYETAYSANFCQSREGECVGVCAAVNL